MSGGRPHNNKHPPDHRLFQITKSDKISARNGLPPAFSVPGFMSAARTPIERWSREELEDRFHSVAENLSAFKQKNNRLERDVKILNGRIGGRNQQRATLPNGLPPPQKDELDDLHRTNQLMAQKLKVLKHQLLNYTKINSTTLASRYRPTTTGQQQQPKNRQGRRPQSAVVRSSANQLATSANRTIADAVAAVDQPKPERTVEANLIGQQNCDKKRRPISQPAAIDEMRGFVENDAVVDFEDISHEIEITTDRSSRNIRLQQQNGGIGNELKEKLREMQRQNRKVTDENEELRFSLEKNEQRLSTLRREYDRTAQELSQSQRELRSQSDLLSSSQEDSHRRAEGSARGAEIADRELAIVREECRALRSAHERLVKKSLEQENSGKAALEELMRLRGKLQQSETENELDTAERETEIQRLRRENTILRETREKEMDDILGKSGKEETNQQTLQPTNEQKRVTQNDSTVNEPKENVKIIQNQRNGGEMLLNKLFSDVLGIVDSHLDSHNKTIDGGAHFPIGDGNSGERWQKLYEDVYFELDKVRKLLLSEHKINVQLKEEKRQIETELDFAKTKCEKQLAELRGELGERGKQIAVLENELEWVAKSGQIRHTVLSASTQKKASPDDYSEKSASAIEPTELTLQISKIVLTEEAIRQAQNPCPMLFLAIEFFDFETQTTKVMNGPEAIFDFTTMFEAPISDLFIHYIQTEGMEVELYSVAEGLNHELWSKAQIPLKKLLSTQTPTQFHGQLKFCVMNCDEKQQPLLLATAFYSMQVPFSLLRALNAQRRRMVASAMIPIGKRDGRLDEACNELLVHIHRCTGIDKLKGVVTTTTTVNKKAQKLAPPSTYVAYEFFNFPVHMTRTVRESANPVFDDWQTWKLPADSEAVHKYLKEKELSFYLIDEGSESLSPDKLSAKAQALGSIHLPLFPLARNHKIRGTFPLMDRADDESIASEASIDVSICWKFAYVFDGFEDLKIEEKTQLKKFVPLTDKNVPKEEVAREEAQKKQKDGVPEMPEQALPGRQQMSKEQKALERIDINRQFSAGSIQSAGSSEDDQSREEMTEEELRRRLLLMPEPSKTFVGEMENKFETIIESGRQALEHKIMNVQENSQVEARTKEAGQSQILEPINVVVSPKSSSSSATVIIDAEKTLERTTSDEISEDLLKEGSSSAEAEAENDEQEDEDARSIRSDATYTAEGPLGPIEMDEPQVKRIEQPDEELMVIQDEDLEGRMGQIDGQQNDEDDGAEQKSSAQTTIPPVPARRSLLGPLQPIITPQGRQLKKHPAPLPPPMPELLTSRKAVEFAEPLHFSIPPSDVSSTSFAEDVTLGSGRSSNSSAEADGSSSSASNATPRNGAAEQRQAADDEQKEKEKLKMQSKKQHRTKKPTKAPIEIAPAPTTPAIRIRPYPEPGQADEGVEESSAVLVPPNSAIVEVQIGKLRLLDNSPLHHAQFDEGRVFVEWNFLDFERDHCVTEDDVEIPRRPTDSVNFAHQSAYELNPNRIALLSQWTELNIRLTFTLVMMDPGEGNGDLDDLCMGELDLLEVLDSSTHSLLMRNVDNLSVAVLEVGVAYSANLLEYMREAMHGIMDEKDDDEGEDGEMFEQIIAR
uniref:C2 domain-containing protein n=1 Tax=Globodera rostochiensis TaxID=31243 RepID=A0A914I078_GLORO